MNKELIEEILNTVGLESDNFENELNSGTQEALLNRMPERSRSSGLTLKQFHFICFQNYQIVSDQVVAWSDANFGVGDASICA